MSGGYGQGIGLKVNLQPALGIEERGLQREARMRQSQEKLQEQQDQKQSAESDKYLHDIEIKPELVHRTLFDDARQNAANYVAKLAQMKQEHPHNYMNYMTEDKMNAERNQAEIVRKSKDLYELEKIPREELTEPQQKVLDVLRTGKKSDLQNINDPMGSVNIGQDGAINFKYTLGKKPDFQEKTVKLLNDIAKSNEDQLSSLGTLPNTSGKLNFLEGKTVPETEKDARAAEARIKQETGHDVTLMSKEKALQAQYKGDPSLQAWYGELNRDKYTSDKSIDWSKANDVHDKMSKDYYNDMKGYGGQTFKNKVVSPIKQTQSEKSDYMKSYGLDKMQKEGKISTGTTRNYAGGTESYPYSMPIATKGHTPVSTGGADVYDMDTNKPISDSKQYEFHAGNIVTKKMPDGKYKSYVDGFGIDQQEVSKNPKLDDMLLELGEWKSKNPDAGKQGVLDHANEIAQRDGYVIDKKIIKNISVPLNKVDNFLQQKEAGNNNTKAIKEATDKLNGSGSVKIHSASRSAWKAAGWSDAQIDEGVKSKKIQVE